MYRIAFFSFLILFACIPPSMAQYLSTIRSESTVLSQDIVLDDAGNAYVTGSFVGTANFSTTSIPQSRSSVGLKDIFVASYDPDGFSRWSFNIGGIAGGPGLDDEGLAIALSDAGAIYVTGYFQGSADFDPGPAEYLLNSAGFRDAFIASYSTDGQLNWAHAFGSSADDRGFGISVFGDRVYATGLFREEASLHTAEGSPIQLASNGQEDGYLLSVSSSGVPEWGAGYGGPSVDSGKDAGVDRDGNVYMLGEYSGEVDFDPSSGELIRSSLNQSTDVVLASYTPEGAVRWAVGLGSAQAEGATGLAVDENGQSYITGHFVGKVDFDPGPDAFELVSQGVRDMFLANYDEEGSLEWAMQLGTDFAEGQDVTVQPDGSIGLIGTFIGDLFPDPASTQKLTSVGEQDILAASYFANGTIKWAHAIGGALTEFGNGIASGPSGLLSITGHFEDEVDFDPGQDIKGATSDGEFDGFIAQYNSDGAFTVGIDRRYSLPEETDLLHIYPNPALSRVTIDIPPVPGVTWEIEVMDILGRRVYFFDEVSFSGIRMNINTSHLAAGTYYVRADGGHELLLESFVVAK